MEVRVAVARESDAVKLEDVSGVLDRQSPGESYGLRDEGQKAAAFLQARVVVERLPQLSAYFLRSK